MFKGQLFIDFSATDSFEECDYYFKWVIRQAIIKTLEHENFPHNASVSVTLCDNEYIKSLNKKYRNKNSATDVLSFPMYDFPSEMSMFLPGETVELGDVVISIERAKVQAKEVGNTFLSEVAFLVIHSTLHLLGYDHERSSEDEERQCAAQREIVKTLDI